MTLPDGGSMAAPASRLPHRLLRLPDRPRPAGTDVGPELVFLSIILLVGVPAAFFNRTALALVGSWAIQEAVCLLTAQASGTMLGLVLDYGVILFALSKPEVRDCSPYPTMWHQIASFWCERSIWDALVLDLPADVAGPRLDARSLSSMVGALVAGTGADRPRRRGGVRAAAAPSFVAMLRTRERPPPGFPRVAASYA
jgi:hypothetical protein